MEPKKVQKNFYVEPEYRKAFETWCTVNGYDQRLVFKAATLAFSSMPIEDRRNLFSEVQGWEEAGYPTLVNEDSPNLRIAAKRPAPIKGTFPAEVKGTKPRPVKGTKPKKPRA